MNAFARWPRRCWPSYRTTSASEPGMRRFRSWKRRRFGSESTKRAHRGVAKAKADPSDLVRSSAKA